MRNMLGWSQMETTDRSGVRLFRGALKADNFSSLCATGGWVKKGSCRTAWSVPCGSSCTGVWRAIARLMKPWCAEGEVPTAANLNHYPGWNSCVGWHRDDEPLFGEFGEAKLVVSVSYGRSAVFKWKGQSCPDNEAQLCWLGHGDILVMDGQCQDEFLHCTDPGRDQDRINVTFRGIKQHAPSCSFLGTRVCMLFANVCAGFISSCYGDSGKRLFLGFWASPWCFVHVGGASFASLHPCVYRAWVTWVCLLVDTSFGRRSVEALSLLPLERLLGTS